MTRKEKQIYKSGRKNPNGYFSYPYHFFKKKYIPVIVVILLICSILIHILNEFNVVSFNKIVSGLGIVNGVECQESDFVVYYLDVGQSDCTVVVCEDEVLVIDSGTLNRIFEIRTSLFTLDINKIDYLLVTHQHDDHMSGAAEIINHYQVSNILMPKISSDNSIESLTYDNLIKTIADKGVNPIAVSSGYSFKVGAALVEILSPVKQNKNLNNMSVVLKITYGDTTFLFQGDAEKEIEKQLLRSGIDISADVLKIGHHGSNTSSDNNFIKAVNPDYAVISCADDNSFGHPHLSVVKRLYENNITPYVTSLNGNVTITSDGKNIMVISEK